MQQNYGIFPKWFRKLLLVFEIELGSIQRVWKHIGEGCDEVIKAGYIEGKPRI